MYVSNGEPVVIWEGEAANMLERRLGLQQATGSMEKLIAASG